MRRLKALGATLVLLVLVVGIPLVMAATIGDPLRGWADLKVGDLTGEVVIDLLAVVVWLAWAQFAVSVIVEVGAAVRHVHTTIRIPLVPGSAQHLARTLVGAALLLGAATAALAGPVHALAAPSARPVAAAAVVVRAQSEAAAHQGADTPQAGMLSGQQTRTAAQGQTVTYVIPGDGHGPDTYWDIAEARLGGGEHWRQIWDLNRGRTQPDGEVMNNPGLLKPGWTVLLPATAGSPAAAAAQLEDVTVHAGDTLSGIAQAYGVSDWHHVWEASKGMAEPGGQHLSEPDLRRP